MSSPEPAPAATEAGAPPPEWLEAKFSPVSPFSLRPSLSTSAGGKTLLVPTPYAVKLALVDAAIRRNGVAAGEHLFEILKRTAVALLPSLRSCVTNTFVRSLIKNTPHEATEEAQDGGETDQSESQADWPFKPTLRYREMCILSGPLIVAFGLREPTAAPLIQEAVRHVNYFGKRGGFVQLVDAQTVREIDPRATVVDPTGWTPATTPAGEVACFLDDLGPRATLARISPYSDERAEWDQERVAVMRILAVRRIASGARFTIYQRLDS